MKTGYSFISIVLLLMQAVPTTAWSANGITDLAALSIQDQSIHKLKSLLKTYRGTEREAELLSRLSDLYLERSGISFRVSEGTSIKHKSALYHQSLKDAVAALSQLIQKFPGHILTVTAHYRRGKAYRELGQIALAKEDYLLLVRDHSDFNFIDSVLIDLSDFAQDANQHQEALGYLKQIEKMPESEYLPIALHKSAWSYFNLGQYESAIHYLEKEMNFYYAKIDAKKSDATAEKAFLDSAFNDLALFYFEAINKKSEFASVDKALALFERLDQKKAYFGITVSKFSKLLKAYTLTQDLNKLRARLIQKFPAMPETTDVALLLYQYHFDRHEYSDLTSLVQDLKGLMNEQNRVRMEPVLSKSLSDLHQLVLKNKLATERGTLLRPLVSLTEQINDCLGNQNTTSLVARYSLAETLFELKEFSQATPYYLGLLKPEYEPILASRKLAKSSIMLRLLSSRYQEIKGQDLFPSKITPKALQATLDPLSDAQKKLTREWIEWVDASKTISPLAEEVLSYEAFYLESSKLVYLYFNREDAVRRLVELARQSKGNVDGVTALTLALDTWSLSEEYQSIYTLTTDSKLLALYKDKAFVEKVNEMRANSHLKITLKSTDKNEVLSRTENCIRDFAGSKVQNECRHLHAKTAVDLGKFDLADKELTSLLSHPQDATHTQSLYLMRASVRNHEGKLADSIQDLNHYQMLTQYQDSEITEQILEYAWFNENSTLLDSLLKNKEACAGKALAHCQQYQVVRTLERDQKLSTDAYQTAFRNTVKAPREVQALWGLIALQSLKSIPFQDRLILLQRIGSAWEPLSPLLQIRVYPRLVSRVQEALVSIRELTPGIAPVKGDTEHLERRMKLLQDIDLTISKIMKINWMAIKKIGASELYLTYDILIKELKKINTPDNLLVPFQKKLAEIQAGIKNIDSMSYDFKPIARAPASESVTPEGLLTGAEVQALIPSQYWAEWKKSVHERKKDYLFHLVARSEIERPESKPSAPAIKGLILLLADAPTEAYALIESIPESPWKQSLVTQFERRER